MAAIIRRDDEVFATQRGYGNYKDWWEFPGGKIEAGETPEQALAREIREELAVVISVDKYLTTIEYDYPEFHLSMACYWCSLKEGRLTLLENEAAKWLPLGHLRQVNWLPADVLVIEAIEKTRCRRYVDLMEKYSFGNADADTVLIQPVDDHDLEGIENEVTIIAERCEKEFCLIAVKINDWNQELSPWEAPAVFGKENFGIGAAETLGKLLELCDDKSRTYYIGGYSLAGLFALWTAYQTDLFSGAAAASPSVWFPGFTEYMKEHDIKTDRVYLSLGDKEERARNPVMASVGKRIQEAYDLLRESGVNTVFEWNEGNHFKDADIRTAKAFVWVLNQEK